MDVIRRRDRPAGSGGRKRRCRPGFLAGLVSIHFQPSRLGAKMIVAETHQAGSSTGRKSRRAASEGFETRRKDDPLYCRPLQPPGTPRGDPAGRRRNVRRDIEGSRGKSSQRVKPCRASRYSRKISMLTPLADSSRLRAIGNAFFWKLGSAHANASESLQYAVTASASRMRIDPI